MDKTVKTEQANLVKLEEQKEAAQEDISESENAIGVLREQLSGLQEDLDAKTKNVEQVKKTTTKASKVLDQALKEIASKVSSSPRCLDPRLKCHVERRNREIGIRTIVDIP